jgi:hypothetical protein
MLRLKPSAAVMRVAALGGSRSTRILQENTQVHRGVMSLLPRYPWLASIRSLASGRVGRVEFGGVSKEITAPVRPDLVPSGYVSTFNGSVGGEGGEPVVNLGPEVVGHLRWMAQKDALRQGFAFVFSLFCESTLICVLLAQTCS